MIIPKCHRSGAKYTADNKGRITVARQASKRGITFDEVIIVSVLGICFVTIMLLLLSVV